MAAVAWGVEHQLALQWAGDEPWRRAVRVGLAISLGLGTLALTARLLRLHEFQVAFGRVWGRVAGRLARRAGLDAPTPTGVVRCRRERLFRRPTTIGPGRPTPAVKALLVATIGIFVVQYVLGFVGT